MSGCSGYTTSSIAAGISLTLAQRPTPASGDCGADRCRWAVAVEAEAWVAGGQAGRSTYSPLAVLPWGIQPSSSRWKPISWAQAATSAWCSATSLAAAWRLPSRCVCFTPALSEPRRDWS